MPAEHPPVQPEQVRTLRVVPRAGEVETVGSVRNDEQLLQPLILLLLVEEHNKDSGAHKLAITAHDLRQKIPADRIPPAGNKHLQPANLHGVRSQQLPKGRVQGIPSQQRGQDLRSPDHQTNAEASASQQ